MIIIDFNAVVIAEFMGEFKGGENVILSENMMRDLVLKSVRRQYSKHRQRFGKELVIACDHKNTWRRDVFPYYKWKRGNDRKKSKVDWAGFNNHLETIIQELKEHFPYRVLLVDGAEADDVIGVLCHTFGNPPLIREHDDILIVSGDKDFPQLQIYDNVYQYAPVKKEFITVVNPERLLREHCMRGDVSDGIPNMRSPDDIFVTEGTRQKSMFTKTVEEQLDMKLIDMVMSLSPEERKWLKRNTILVDLKFTPKNIQRSILDAYENYSIPDRSGLFNYLINNGMRDQISNIGEF